MQAKNLVREIFFSSIVEKGLLQRRPTSEKPKGHQKGDTCIILGGMVKKGKFLSYAEWHALYCGTPFSLFLVEITK